MARINYYQFPEHMDAHARFKAGADHNHGQCSTGRDSCRYCPNNPHEPNLTNGGSKYLGAWKNCENWICAESEETISGISITYAKQLLKKYGGRAYTRHIDRDGGCFEVTEIKLKANNSRHKYNRHL